MRQERGLASAAAVLALLPLAATLAVFAALGIGYGATVYRVWGLAQFAAGELSAHGGWNAVVDGRVLRFASEAGLDPQRLCLPADQPGLNGSYLPYGQAALLSLRYSARMRLPLGGQIVIPIQATAAWTSHYVPALTTGPAAMPAQGGCQQ